MIVRYKYFYNFAAPISVLNRKRMNKKRRNVLRKVIAGLMKLRDPIDKKTAMQEFDKRCNNSGEIYKWLDYDEEDDCLSGLPENLAWSARSTDMADNVSDLGEVSSDLEIIIDELDESKKYDYGKIKQSISDSIHTLNSVIYR